MKQSDDWASAGLSQCVEDAVDIMGLEKMTPVQAATVPLFLKNKDVVVEAVTGSGKTLAYLLPLLEKILRRDERFLDGQVAAIVVSPTRELAQQIFKVWNDLIALLDLDCYVAGRSNLDADDQDEKTSDPAGLLRKDLQAQMVIGGHKSIKDDLRKFTYENPRVLFGTPGRLNDLLNEKSGLVKAKQLEMLILDEADILLDMGFQATLQGMLQRLPKQRRTGLFSATMNDAVSEFIRIAGLRNSVKIVVNVKSTKKSATDDEQVRRAPASLSIYYHVVPRESKTLVMLDMLAAHPFEKAIVYFPTCACVDYFTPLVQGLEAVQSRFKIVGLHGKQAPSNRARNFKEFQEVGRAGSHQQRKSVLFTTDVAARGLDIPNVDFVIQMDPPLDPKAFSHRSGRAGRAGKSGEALVLLSEGREEEYVDLLKVRSVPIAPLPPDFGTLPANLVATSDLREVVQSDRDISDKSIVAFVSYVQAYRKHQASYIFRIKDLEIGSLAESFALLSMPRMPETKGKEDEIRAHFHPPSIDITALAYRDKAREAARLEARPKEAPEPGAQHNQKKVTTEPAKAKSAVAWSNKKIREEKSLARKEKKKRKRDAILRNQTEPVTPLEADQDDEEAEKDWKDFVKRKKTQKKSKGRDVMMDGKTDSMSDLPS